jgi:predicted lipoprotein with Yx(FWY)xxD motif
MNRMGSASRIDRYNNEIDASEDTMRSGMIAGLALCAAAGLAACSSGSSHDTTAAPSPATQLKTSQMIDVGSTQLGKVLVNVDGRTLYGFTNDVNGTSTCNGTCAQNWPPVIVTPGWTATPAAQAANLHTVKRDNGQLQLAAGKWPLYTFAGDDARGDVNGQGSENFFVVQPDGKLHKDVAPATTVPPMSSEYGY